MADASFLLLFCCRIPSAISWRNVHFTFQLSRSHSKEPRRALITNHFSAFCSLLNRVLHGWKCVFNKINLNHFCDVNTNTCRSNHTEQCFFLKKQKQMFYYASAFCVNKFIIAHREKDFVVPSAVCWWNLLGGFVH